MKKVDNSTLILANKIYNSIKKDKFASFVIIGDRNIGKSTYGLKSLQGAFKKLGYTDNDAWKESIKSIKFAIPDVISYIRKGLDTNKKLPCLIWDDVRIFASGSQYFLNIKLYNELLGLLDGIKVAVNCLILTCPSMQGVLNVLKSYDDFQIKIKPSSRGGEYRLAKAYKWDTLPSGMRRIYHKFNDTFYCRVPDIPYRKYYKMRKQATMDRVVGVEKAI